MKQPNHFLLDNPTIKISSSTKKGIKSRTCVYCIMSLKKTGLKSGVSSYIQKGELIDTSILL